MIDIASVANSRRIAKRFAKELQGSRTLATTEYSHGQDLITHLGNCILCSCERLSSHHPSYATDPLCKRGRDRVQAIDASEYLKITRFFPNASHGDRFPVRLEIPPILERVIDLLRAIVRGFEPQTMGRTILQA